MSNLVSVFYQHLTQVEASHSSCGVILVSCKHFSKELEEKLKRDFEQLTPEISAHYVYDKSKNLLGVLLEQQRLCDTHFHALLIKDYLLERNLLDGSLLIASFPESAKSGHPILLRMIQEAKDLNTLGAIKIYYDAASPKEDSSARILLVNQDETVNEFLSVYLKRKGYQVAIAHDGMDGVQKYQELTPDLVITDLNLPILSGYQLMERIRHQECEQASKIIVLTDKRLEDDVRKSFALGASDYITKPFSPVELEARVKRLIS